MNKISTISVLCLLMFLPTISNACSIDNIDLFIQNNIKTANKYWLISAVIAPVVMLVNYLSVKNKFFYLLPLFIILFHPAWTIDHAWGIDCVSNSVWQSKVVTSFLCLLLAYLIYKYFNLIWPEK